MKSFNKVFIPVLVFLLMVLILIWGVVKEDHREVEFNGNILCLSCIGIE